MSDLVVAAVDLGAESGRVAGARFDGRRLELDIAHRFPTLSQETNGWLRWNVDELWSEISSGLGRLGARTKVASVGVDTWGIDVGLYDADGELFEHPVTYRDTHRVHDFERAISRVGAQRMYDATGTQLLEINTVFGLLADTRLRPDVIRRADLMLMMPDIIHRLLSGSSVTEYTAATTTGFYDMAARRWATDLLDELEIPTQFLPEVAPSGTDVGPVIGELAGAGLGATRVVLPAAHDTASAVLSIPQADAHTMFISSGTWSLVGVVLDEPIITATSRRMNLTNEGGYGGSVRFLRNVMGLWVLQESRRQWAREGIEIDYSRLTELADAVTPLRSVVNLNAAEFIPPGDMPQRIRDFCRRTGQPVPETIGEVARVISDSLALSYRLTLEDIEASTGQPITSIAVVGGGGANEQLQQSTASATGRPVVCWAREATALGNAAAQLVALGELEGVDQIWSVIEASTERSSFEPHDTYRWHDAAQRLREYERAELRRRGLEEPTHEAPSHSGSTD